MPAANAVTAKVSVFRMDILSHCFGVSANHLYTVKSVNG